MNLPHSVCFLVCFPSQGMIVWSLLNIFQPKLIFFLSLCGFLCSSATGPILCGKPILSSTVPSYCASHYEKADRYMVRALKKAGLSASSTSKCAPKFHVLTSEYVRQIMSKRRAAQQAKLEIGEVKQENHSWRSWPRYLFAAGHKIILYPVQIHESC